MQDPYQPNSHLKNPEKAINVRFILSPPVLYLFIFKIPTSKYMKCLADSKNSLEPVNRIHRLLKMLLNAHSGFCRDDLQNYLNLYTFVINPPSYHLEKVQKTSIWFLKIPNLSNIVTNPTDLLFWCCVQGGISIFILRKDSFTV